MNPDYNKNVDEVVAERAKHKAKSALSHQVGGDHYKDFVIQPVVFVVRNNLGFLEGSIIEYICRYDKPGGKGIQDLEKIKHEIDLIIELKGIE